MRAGPPARRPAAAPGRAARLLLVLLAGYQRWISPALGQRCRFWPTCSSYAAQAVRDRGAVLGSWLAVRRLARCHPFHPGGHDPVPPARSASQTMDAPAPTPPTPATGRPAPARQSSPVHCTPRRPRSRTPRRTGADPC